MRARDLATVTVCVALSACFVSFDDYPVSDSDAGSGASGGAGGMWPDGSSGEGGASGGGAGTESGGSGGGSGAASGGTAGSGGSGGAAATGGSNNGGSGGGTTVECGDYIAGLIDGTCHAYVSGPAPNVASCTGFGSILASCADTTCLKLNGEACKPGLPANMVIPSALCHLLELSPQCSPVCDNTLTNIAYSIDRACDGSGKCSGIYTSCGNYACDVGTLECKDACKSNADCVPKATCVNDVCQ